MNRSTYVLALVLVLGLVSKPVKAAQDASDTPGAEAVIRSLQTTWNRADMDGYLAAYRNDEQLRLVFGNTILEGMNSVSEVFRRNYPDEHNMGKFTIDSLSVRYLSDDVAVATGTFEHVFPHETIQGGFSHVLMREEGGWVIQHEHTSRGKTISHTE